MHVFCWYRRPACKFHSKCDKSPLEYLNTLNPDSFCIFPVTEIENEIASLKAGKDCGPSSIPITALKLIKQVISKPLEIPLFPQGLREPSSLR